MLNHVGAHPSDPKEHQEVCLNGQQAAFTPPTVRGLHARGGPSDSFRPLGNHRPAVSKPQTPTPAGQVRPRLYARRQAGLRSRELGPLSTQLDTGDGSPSAQGSRRQREAGLPPLSPTGEGGRSSSALTPIRGEW